MPIVPSFIERMILLRLNLGPAPLLDFFGALAFRAASVAVKLGVLRALGEGPMTAAQVARRIEADERGTTFLLDALDSLGYVHKRNGRYTATPMTKKWAPLLAEGIPFAEAAAFEQWQHLEERVAGRKPPIHSYEAIEREGSWREFQNGMLALARSGVGDVVAKVKLPRAARRLLDLGGGHGLYSVELCRRYPNLSATVFDFLQALDVTRELIAAENMADRVSVEEGDFWTDSIGSGYDVALLFNIVHANLPEKNTILLQKVSGSLNPGGRVVILDQLADSKGSGPAARAIAALTGLNMYNSSGGQSYAFEEIARWLSVAGFANPQRITLLRSPGNSLVLATKAA